MNLNLLIQRVLYHMAELPPPDIIVVFTLNADDVQTVTDSIVEELPIKFSSTVQIHSIDNSERVLKSVHSRGQKTYRVVYNSDVFRYITPEQFLKTHYRWLEKQVNFFYEKNYDIHDELSEDDLFQECYFYLDKILCKFEEQCNLRTFVYNRLRRYVSRLVEGILKKRLADLRVQVRLIEEYEQQEEK